MIYLVVTGMERVRKGIGLMLMVGVLIFLFIDAQRDQAAFPIESEHRSAPADTTISSTFTLAPSE